MDQTTNRSATARQSLIARRVVRKHPRNDLISKIEKRGKNYDASVNTSNNKLIAMMKFYFKL